MTLDPTTDIGKIRLRVGDYTDLAVFTDDVYSSAINDTLNADNSSNLPRAAILMAQYILGALSFETTQKISILEVFGNLVFEQYLQFIKATIMNPNFMQISPIPYTANAAVTPDLIQFQQDWNLNYAYGTQSEMLHITALGGWNDGTNNGYF